MTALAYRGGSYSLRVCQCVPGRMLWLDIGYKDEMARTPKGHRWYARISVSLRLSPWWPWARFEIHSDARQMISEMASGVAVNG